MFVFREIGLAFFSWNTHFEIRPFVLLQTNWRMQLSLLMVQRKSPSWKIYKSLQLLLLITMFSSKVQLVLFGPKKEKNWSTNFLSCLFQSIHFLPCPILVPYNSRLKLMMRISIKSEIKFFLATLIARDAKNSQNIACANFYV